MTEEVKIADKELFAEWMSTLDDLAIYSPDEQTQEYVSYMAGGAMIYSHTEIFKLLKRVERLEQRVKELEARFN
ncbi:hypothetical protein K1728_10045 [Weissella confusa]|uniref:hypothetical protein n=1 Tax=Weissella confusa TaxID=1583 RepID=UPI000DCA37EC|nr:hypothetical protein [Weissella confusa]QYU57487.1 hypothetical protein K1728_10045 [Weissella confusa]RAU06604.1 hypothetical protein DEJ53_07255 [Weissella confusa]TGE61748.1 hypothetical protein C6P21_02355 [Weissella confusa]